MSSWVLIASAFFRYRAVLKGHLDARPWLPWVFPILCALGLFGFVGILDWLVKTCTTPLHLGVLLTLCGAAALCTVPLFAWAHVPNWILSLLVLNALHFVQYCAAFSMVGMGRAAGILWGIPNLLLFSYILFDVAVFLLTRSDRLLRQCVYDMYTFRMPLVIVPQILILSFLASAYGGV